MDFLTKYGFQVITVMGKRLIGLDIERDKRFNICEKNTTYYCVAKDNNDFDIIHILGDGVLDTSGESSYMCLVTSDTQESIEFVPENRLERPMSDTDKKTILTNIINNVPKLSQNVDCSTRE